MMMLLYLAKNIHLELQQSKTGVNLLNHPLELYSCDLVMVDTILTVQHPSRCPVIHQMIMIVYQLRLLM